MSVEKSTQGMHHDFNRIDRDRPVRGKLDFEQTTREQIVNTKTHEQALDAHFWAWKDQMRQMATKQDSAPEFALGASRHRDLLQEYETRRTGWMRQADQIDQRFEVNREIIRGSGHTLQQEFSVPQHERGRSRSR